MQSPPARAEDYQRHDLVSGDGPARRFAQVQVLLYQFWQAQAPGQGGRKLQP